MFRIDAKDVKEDGNRWVYIFIPKAVAIFTRQEFVTALARGKQWRRQEAMAKREAPST